MNLLYANPYAFSPGESVGPHVSRSSLRLVCLSGRGLLDVPDGGWKLQPGMVVGLPMACPRWYRAADKDPFVLIGIHVGQANEPLDHPSVARWPVTGAIPTSGWLKHDHAGHATQAAQRLPASAARVCSRHCWRSSTKNANVCASFPPAPGR